jgi:peroxin-5
MDEFAQQRAQLPGMPVEAAWNMDKLHQSLPHQGMPADQRHWATEFSPGLQGPQMTQAPGFSAGEFARFQNASPGMVERTASPMAANQAGMMGYRPQFGGYAPPMGMMGMGGMSQFQPPPQVQQLDKGKGRMVELDDNQWEEQFKQLEQSDRDLDAEANAAINIELEGIDRSVEDTGDQLETETDHFGDFESIWRGIQAETQNARELAEEEMFENGLGMDDWNDFDGLNTHTAETPSLGDYLFEQNNPFQQQTDPYAEGVEIMDSGGNLSLAALAFEAAVQKDPSHVEAWVRLGSAQAQNEKEIPAIRALERALSLDPGNLEALMSLAVSYTNEGYETSAYRTLERWVSVKYPQVITAPLDEPKEIGFTQRIELHQKVTDLFIQAAQLSPSGELMDPDVQVGLGVLFYAADDHSTAVDCFTSAIESGETGVVNQRQNMHLLWNRLGATMANSGRSEEAIQAYERALELRPNFVRARYNLGVSCINMGVLPEAAGHLLGALEMHRVDEVEARQKAREIVSGGDGDAAVSDNDLDKLINQNSSTVSISCPHELSFPLILLESI